MRLHYLLYVISYFFVHTCVGHSIGIYGNVYHLGMFCTTIEASMNNNLIRQLYKFLAIVVGLIALWQLQLVALILLVSFMLTVILMPFVRVLHRYKLPSLLAVLIPLIVFVSLLVGIGYYVAPAISDQAPDFVRELPVAIIDLPVFSALGIEEADITELFRDRVADIGSTALVIGASLLQGFGLLLTVLVLTMYWLRGYDSIKETLLSYIPKQYQLRAEDIWQRAEVKLSRWFLGQILISSAVGIAVWLTMLALGVPFAGVLGLIAALLEIIPLIGPILASIPGILFALTDSFEFGLIVTFAYIIISQLESQVLSPLLMGKAVHLHPIVVLTAFLIGTFLYGIIGGLLAVPTALLVSAGVDSLRSEPFTHKETASKA